MEKLWFNLSRNVLEEMIKFVPRSADEDNPKFLLEVEKVTPSMGRYILNLIDGTNLEIFSLTSAEYSKIFPAQVVIPRTVIRILRYWIFRIECHSDDLNQQQFKYIIMILNAEIIKLSPAKTIESINRVTSKTPRIRGIVDVCSDKSYTSHDEPIQRFRLKDHTGSIECSAVGAIYTPLSSILKEGVKIELSHAMVTKADLENRMSYSKFELKLNQFSVLKIYDSDDLTLLFAYSSQDIVKKLSDQHLIHHPVKTSDTSSSQCSDISKLLRKSGSNDLISDQPNSSKQSSSSQSNLNKQNISFQRKFESAQEPSNTPLQISSNQQNLIQPSSSQQNLSEQTLQVEQNLSSSIPRTELCETESSQAISNQLDTVKQCSVSEPKSSHSIPQTESCEFKSTLCKSNQKHTLLQRNSSLPRKLSIYLPPYIKRRCCNGKAPVPLASLTNPGVFNSWIRGIVEGYVQLETILVCFYLRDESTVMRCTVMEPASKSLNTILKNGMTLEIVDFDVKPVTESSKMTDHSHELFLTKFVSINALSPDNKLIYKYKISNISFTRLGKMMSQKEPPRPLEDLEPKYIDGRLSIKLSSVIKHGFCSSWIRGVVEYYSGKEITRSNVPYIIFHIRDNTAIIPCIVWDPICSPLSHVLKENMIIETKNYSVARSKTSKVSVHKLEIFLNSSGSIRIFSADDTMVYEYLSS